MLGFWIGLALFGFVATWGLLRRPLARFSMAPWLPASRGVALGVDEPPPGTPGNPGTAGTPGIGGIDAPVVAAAPAAVAPSASIGSVAPPPVEAGPRPMPLALENFTLRQTGALPHDRLNWTLERLRAIPHPPSALHRMSSLDFVGKSTSAELADVVMSEPLVAARVMARVHSPVYGLRQSVETLGQAITFIGTTSVRNICMRYLLEECFKTDSGHIRKIFESLSEASTLASELCLKLGRQIQLADAPALMTRVLLSYTGHLAATVLQVDRRGGTARTHAVSLLGRCYGQQQEIGLPGAEIGTLLMREWKLPKSMTDDVALIDRVLVTPVEQMPPDQAAELALGYLCCRLADRIVAGQIVDTREIDTLMELDADFHHLPGYLALPALSGLREALLMPEG